MALRTKNFLGLSMVVGSPFETFGSVYHYFDPFHGLNKKCECPGFLYAPYVIAQVPAKIISCILEMYGFQAVL